MSWLKSKMRAAASIVAQAAEAVAPTLSLSMSLYKTPVEEFHHRWSTISLFLDALIAEELTEAQQRAKLTDSNTRDNLAKLVKLLYAEEDALERRVHDLETSMDTRPCMEYMLEHDVLQSLCAKAAQDSPSGLMVLVLIFLTDLLRESRINYPILPTRGVYRSVCELIQAAMAREVEDDMVQKCLLHCLHALWVKLKGDPVQTEFFFLRIYKTVAGNGDSNLALSPSKISELVLFTGLLPHMYREGKLGHKCREALAIAAGLHEPGLSRFILHMTPFCNYAVTGVIQAYDALPKTIGVKNEKTFRSVDPDAIALELEVLALRLRFCCTLAMVGTFKVETSITAEILTQFHTRFLQGPLLDALLDTSEAAARTAVNYTVTIIEMLVSCGATPEANPLLHLTLSFLLHHHHARVSTGNTLPVVTASQELNAPKGGSEIRLMTELLNRMNSLSASLSVAAINLCTSLLRLDCSLVDSILLPVRPAEDQISPTSPSTSTTTIPRFAARFPHSSVAAITANTEIWQAIKVHAVLPNTDAEMTPAVLSLLTYIASAEQRVCCTKTKELLDDNSDTELSDDDGSPATTWQVRVASLTDVPGLMLPLGASLTTLFESILLTRLDRWLDNSLEENIALSGLVVLLADRAPSFVFDWDGLEHDENEELPRERRSIRVTLEDVHRQAHARIQRMQQGRSRLQEVRQKLWTTTDETLHEGSEVFESHEMVLVGHLVLEEMLKELVGGLVAHETICTLPVKPEGSYLKPQPKSLGWSDDDEDDQEIKRKDSLQREEDGSKVEELDSFLDSAASQLRSIMGSTTNQPTPP